MPIMEEFERDLVHHFSDSGFKIRQVETGDIYDDAWDLAANDFHYEETDIPIETGESEEDDYAEAGRIMLGER